MNLRRIAKSLAAALLAVGALSASVAPTTMAPSADTGWGFARSL